MPRPEIDLVALHGGENELLLIEAKSYLDSYGVDYESVSGKDPKTVDRYRLFTNDKFRKIVSMRLREAFLEDGLINKDTKINYALAAGHIHSTWDEQMIEEYFARKGWRLFTPKQIKVYVEQLSRTKWEDDLATMTAKLLLRK